MQFLRVRVWALALGSVLSGCAAAHGRDASAVQHQVPAASPLAAAPAPAPAPAPNRRVVRITGDDILATTPVAETNPDAPRALLYDHGSGHPAASFPDAPTAPIAAPAAPSVAPAAPGVATPLRGTVSNAAKVVSAMRSDFRHCYQTALADEPKLEGSVRLLMRVAADGSVSEATGTPNSLSPAVVDCILRRAYQAKFEPPEGGSAVIVVPITFVRREPDQ
jgi:hypothetical protein